MHLYAGLIYDDSRHYIDHLAPFCAQMHWPLIVCEPAIKELCLQYYPGLEVIEVPLRKVKLPRVVLSCDNLPLLQATFPHQEINMIWLPHGNSDKGLKGPFFEGVGDLALVYGQKMIDFMHAKGTFPKTIRVGNFRFAYFQKHKSFYEKILPLPVGKKVLYAPTWEDGENSFWNALPANAPAGHHLLIKFHPNTYLSHPAELEVLMGKMGGEKHITFLPNIPPIYPILDVCESYIGDASSIGYDFLTFNRPLHLLKSKDILPLHSCEGKDTLPSVRKAMYDYTFDPMPEPTQIQEQIDALCRL